MLVFEIMNLIWSNDYMTIAWHNKDFELDFIPDDEDLDINMDKMKDKMKVPKLGKSQTQPAEPEVNDADDKRTQLTDENVKPEEKA